MPASGRERAKTLKTPGTIGPNPIELAEAAFAGFSCSANARSWLMPAVGPTVPPSLKKPYTMCATLAAAMSVLGRLRS